MLRIYSTLLPYLRRYAGFYALGILCLIVTNSGQLLMPQWIKQAIDHLAKSNAQLGVIAQIMVGMASTAFVVALGRIGWRYFIIGSARKIEQELRQKLIDHLFTLPPSFYQTQKTGDLMARATNDIDAIRMSLGIALVAFTDAIFISGSVLVIILVQNPLLALLIISPLPIITLVIVALGGLVGRLFKKVQEEYSALTNFVQEHLAGNRVVKAFVQEKNTDKRFLEGNLAYRSANLKLVKLWGFFFPMIAALSGLSGLFLLYFGGKAVMDHQMSVGDFTAYLAYLAMLIWPVMGAGMVVNMLQRGSASLKRINEILDTQSEIRSPETGAVAKPKNFDIEIKNLSFRYTPETGDVLKNLNFSIPEGTFLGVLGKLGSGKSTLTMLLPRLYDPPKGSVEIGGIPVQDYDLVALRRCFSMVPQTTFLFSDTIRNNIAFGNADASEETLQRMAELSTISRDIENFAQGWNTLVGERGVTLSGGQKQRLSLSRALAADAPILILDDALSAVDVETEEKIIRHLKESRKGKTNILISHRVNTLKHCQTIVVLDDGMLVQQGTHQELLRQEGIYREIAVLQHAEKFEES